MVSLASPANRLRDRPLVADIYPYFCMYQDQLLIKNIIQTNERRQDGKSYCSPVALPGNLSYQTIVLFHQRHWQRRVCLPIRPLLLLLCSQKYLCFEVSSVASEGRVKGAWYPPPTAKKKKKCQNWKGVKRGERVKIWKKERKKSEKIWENGKRGKIGNILSQTFNISFASALLRLTFPKKAPKSCLRFLP